MSRNEERNKRITQKGSTGRGHGSSGGLSGVKNVEEVDAEWEVINITADSGAVDNAVNRECGGQFGMRETRMSKNGGYYTVANDVTIYNEGERGVKEIIINGLWS